MWQQFYNSTYQYLAHLTLEQTTVFVLAVVAIGFFCMRGFGSRSNY